MVVIIGSMGAPQLLMQRKQGPNLGQPAPGQGNARLPAYPLPAQQPGQAVFIERPLLAPALAV